MSGVVKRSSKRGKSQLSGLARSLLERGVAENTLSRVKDGLGRAATRNLDFIIAAINGSSDEAVNKAFPRVLHLPTLFAAVHQAGYAAALGPLITDLDSRVRHDDGTLYDAWKADLVPKTVAKEVLLDHYRKQQYSRLRSSELTEGDDVTEDDARRRKLMTLCDGLVAGCDSSGVVSRISSGADGRDLTEGASSTMRSLVAQVIKGKVPETIKESRFMSRSDLDTALDILGLAEFVMNDAGGTTSAFKNRPDSVTHKNLLRSWLIEAAHAVASRGEQAMADSREEPGGYDAALGVIAAT